MEGSNHFLAGKVDLMAHAQGSRQPFELTPTQARLVFEHLQWQRVIGFHTRNACHRVHEYIQQEALKQSGADGLYINPVIGPKKQHDFLPRPILDSYQALLDRGVYPDGKVTYSSWKTVRWET